MPPKKTAPISHGVATRHRTRSAPAEEPVVASPPKKPKQYASSTDDSDIEVDICDESQVEYKLLQGHFTTQSPIITLKACVTGSCKQPIARTAATTR